MPIRWRLTLWFSLIVLAVLVLTGTLLYLLTERNLHNAVDDNLRVYSARVHGTLKPEEIPDPLNYEVIHSRLAPINEFSVPGVYLQLIDQSGRVVVKSDNLGRQELPVDPALIERGFSGKPGIATLAAGGGARVRLMVSPLYLRDQALVLEVAQSLSHVDVAMDQLTWILSGVILLALALVGISGAVTVRRVLSPVERITRTARSIEASPDLDRRVSYRGPADEIGQLATTFDLMISRLNKVFESQKSFIADASHELRSPLTVIQGNLDLLKRNLSEIERRESLRAIETESRRMTKIVSDLLLLAEVESGQVSLSELVSLKGLIAEEIGRAQSLAGQRRIVTGDMEDLSIVGDAYRLRQLLGNLVDNAIKYTPEDGAITISLHRDGDWARLAVADTGIGISPEHLPHIFDRFYRVDKARARDKGSTGLGLAIVKGIAERHRGKVTVTSEAGKGSTFIVWLKL